MRFLKDKNIRIVKVVTEAHAKISYVMSKFRSMRAAMNVFETAILQVQTT